MSVCMFRGLVDGFKITVYTSVVVLRFFFFKQKTAYEISACLVGSEMCIRDSAKSEGIEFVICSTYRSYSTQDTIYHNYVSMYGADYANTISAYPGRSEHHTGWAVDVTSASMGYDLKQNFIEYPEGIWINNHCSEYGFIIRYPKDKTHITGYSYEPWHLRYVGVDVAKEITEKGLTLEEYLGK